MLPTLLESPVRPPPAPAAHARAGRAVWLPLVLVVALYLGASVGPALFDQNEAQYAAAAREMIDRPGDYQPATHGQLERGHWFIPTNDGIPRLQKPPLVYWILMASVRVFGPSELGVRLPNALVALLWFAATFLLGRRIGGSAVGASAATILATMAGTFIFCHLIAPEPFLAAFLTLTFWCFLGACGEPAKAGRWMFGAWLFMALGTMCKGLHGALYPLAVAAVLAWRHPGTRPAWKRLLHPSGPLIFLAILVPWYAAIERSYPGFLRDQFINEQLGHAINHRYPPDSERVPFLVFWLEHLVFFLPWTLFLPAALSTRRASGADPRPALGRDLLAAWFVVTTLSILSSTLQDYYLMTAWGPVAFWLTRPWTASDPGGRALPAWMRVGPGLALTTLGMVALTAAAYLRLHLPAEGNSADAGVVRDTLLGTVTGFSLSAWDRLQPLLWLTGADFLVGGLAAAWLAMRGRWQLVLPAVAVTMIGVLVLATRGLCVLEDYFSLKQVALAANRLADRAAMVVCVGEPADNPSLLYYLDREVYWTGASPAGEFASRELKIGANLYLNEDEVARQWNSGRNVFLILESANFDRWAARMAFTPAQRAVVARAGTRVMVCNHAPAHW